MPAPKHTIMRPLRVQYRVGGIDILREVHEWSRTLLKGWSGVAQQAATTAVKAVAKTVMASFENTKLGIAHPGLVQ